MQAGVPRCTITLLLGIASAPNEEPSDPTTTMTRKLSGMLAAALGLGCTPVLTHPPLPASGQFVVQLGTDTLAIERYTRTADRLDGDIVLRSPRLRTLHYSAALGAGGEMRSLTTTVRRAGAASTAPAGFVQTITFGPTTTVEVMRNGQRDTTSGVRTYQGIGVPTVPSEPPAYGIYEQILAAHPITGGSVELNQLGSPGLPVAPLILARRGPDSVVFSSAFFPGTPWTEVARVDRGGRILGVNAMGTTIRTLAHRDDNFDFNRVVSDWAAQEAAGRGMGQTSSLDTTRATVGGASLEVVYSRPMRRGRVIFGNVVPWGEVWRTGANAATQLTTSRDLMFGNTLVPAGKYTIFTLPTPSGAKLMINSQTGQWGTDYDSKRDLARLDLETMMLAAPMEKFTISIEPAGNGGVLRMAWGDRAYSIPFTAK